MLSDSTATLAAVLLEHPMPVGVALIGFVLYGWRWLALKVEQDAEAEPDHADHGGRAA